MTAPPHVPGLDSVLSPDGWPYASAPSTGPDDPGRFHALFGRDSLITALQLLPVRPDVAAASLRALGRLQGSRTDPLTEEEPGKIGHEFRSAAPEAFVRAGWPAEGEFRYYGTADATSWYLVLLAALNDLNGADGADRADLTAELAPVWQAAGRWLAAALDRGHGLLAHAPSHPNALGQQGWRDTIDPVRDKDGGGILRPDGTAPMPPLADLDTQAVTVVALRALTRLTGEPHWTARADELRAAVSAVVPDAIALEGPDRRAVGGAGSQLGWLLWADALEPAAARLAADRLCEPDILTDFGVRTLGTGSPVFRVDGYHRGAIWPFDSWLAWGGLRAAGREAAAERVRTGVLAALDQLGRFPELYAVGQDGQLGPVPVANRVQAWTIGARWALTHGWDGRPEDTPA